MTHIFASGDLTPKNPYLEITKEELQLIIDFLEKAKKDKIMISVERKIKKSHGIKIEVLD